MHATTNALAVQRRLRKLVQQRENQLSATQPVAVESSFEQTRKVERLFFQKFSEKHQLSKRDIKKFFARYDTDKSGVLEESEFRAAISSFLNGVTEQEVQLLLRKYDFNGDRRVSIEEFTEYLTRFGESSGDPTRKGSMSARASSAGVGHPPVIDGSRRSAQHQRRASHHGASVADALGHDTRKPPTLAEHRRSSTPQPQRQQHQQQQNIPVQAWGDNMSEYRTYSEIQYDAGDSLQERVKGALRNLRALLEQKASAQRSGIPASDRLAKRSAEVNEEFGRRYMRKVFQKLGDGSSSTSLAFRDFITMLRKMQYPGQRSLTEEEMKFLYDLSNRGDCDALCDAIFDRERCEANQFGFTRVVPAVTRSNRPEVGEGPFSSSTRFNSIAEVPLRLRYKHSKTRVCPPSDFDVNDIAASARAPPYSLKREFVFGMTSSHSVGQPLHAAQHGKLAYCIAGLGVSYDPVSNSQAYFDRHSDDVTCIAINHSGSLVATGQMGKEPCVWVWDAHSGEPRVKLGVGRLDRAVSAIGFTHDSRYLFCISCDDHNMLCIFELATGAFIAEYPCQHGTPPRILQVVCSPGLLHDGTDPTSNAQYESIVTVGKSHVRFWRFRRDLLRSADQQANWLSSKLGAYGKVGQQPRTTHFARFVGTATASATLDTSTVLTGGDNGVIHMWRNESCVAAIQAHKGPVVSALLTQNILYTGGQDGLLKSWNLQTLSPIKSLDVTRMQAENSRAQGKKDRPASGRSATPSASRRSSRQDADRGGTSRSRVDNSPSEVRAGIVAVVPVIGRAEPQDIQRPSDTLREIYVLTKRGTLLRVDVRAQNAERCAVSHFAPVFGVAVANATPDLFATTGEDGLLCLWNAHTHRIERRTVLPDMGRSCDFSPDDSIIAVGLKNGAVVVYNRHDLRKIAAFKDNEETIDDLKFSPNGQFLATGSHDNFIDIYDCRRGFKRVRRLKGHTSYVTHLDWSADSTLIQSNCGAYEILYWDVAKGRQLLSSGDQVEADTHWHTNTCVLGFSVMGIWARDSDGTDVNALQAMPSRNLVVTADDFGGVNLLTYPCVVKNAPGRRHGGHSSHVMNIRAPVQNPGWVVSVGGNDQCAQLWRIVPYNEPAYDTFDDGMSGTTYLC